MRRVKAELSEARNEIASCGQLQGELQRDIESLQKERDRLRDSVSGEARRADNAIRQLIAIKSKIHTLTVDDGY